MTTDNDTYPKDVMPSHRVIWDRETMHGPSVIPAQAEYVRCEEVSGLDERTCPLPAQCARLGVCLREAALDNRTALQKSMAPDQREWTLYRCAYCGELFRPVGGPVHDGTVLRGGTCPRVCDGGPHETSPIHA